MANHVDTSSEASLTQLVAGILTDVQELIKQQLALLRYELQGDLRKVHEAGLLLAGGLAITLVSCVLFGLMLVYLLSWVAPAVELWLCYGVVGTLFAALAGALWLIGIRKLKSCNPVAGQTAQALKENLQWMTK